ncbi:uncharacterized protein LOC114579453 [Dendrobium catenatum]|uniref:uncharacterized protein LOC114579453 n=1 Tax=Dendrobium catenatum TaxID=906689 RepID=UPI0010A0796B|nr:uncharacterized protein LOC114579453 [Dendrobium catenatum]
MTGAYSDDNYRRIWRRNWDVFRRRKRYIFSPVVRRKVRRRYFRRKIRAGNNLSTHPKLAYDFPPKRASETYISVRISMFSGGFRSPIIRVIEVLEIIKEEGVNDQQSVEAGTLIDVMESFDFIFTMHLMIDILGITNELSQSLQRKDQDIENAMKLMYETYKTRRRTVRRGEEITNLHHYRVELFYIVVDMQLQEINNRFSESSTELLLCVACLNPTDTFQAYDERKLIRLAELYSNDFSTFDLVALKSQLSTYIIDMRTSTEFSSLNSIAYLSKQIVKFKKDDVYPLVYRLIILTLTLPVATATVERAFMQ